MSFAQLTYRESLRDIVACLRAMKSKLYHMGIRDTVARSILARANEKRDWRIYADFAQVLIHIASTLCQRGLWGRVGPNGLRARLQHHRPLFISVSMGALSKSCLYKRVRGVMFRENNKVEQLLSRTEEVHLYEVCLQCLPRRIYWIVYTAFQTGMRRGELLNPKWENVDLVNRTITIEAAIAKSGKSRTIPINKNLTVLLKAVKKETHNAGEYVFSGAKPLKNIKTSFSKAKRLADIDPKFRFHDIRHTVASRLVTEHNVDLITVQKILGHSSLNMLERYAHSRKEIEMNAVEALGDAGIAPELHKNCTILETEETNEKSDSRKLLQFG